MDDKSQVIARVCEALSQGDKDLACAIARTEYAFMPGLRLQRNLGDGSPAAQSDIGVGDDDLGSGKERVRHIRAYIRDGFLDQYFGKRLVFPGVLELLTRLMPDEFPYNGKLSESHIMFWDLWPSIDHIKPRKRNGPDVPSNWTTTSATINFIKNASTPEELGWQLGARDDSSRWDGLHNWFLEYLGRTEYREDKTLRGWHNDLKKALQGTPASSVATTGKRRREIANREALWAAEFEASIATASEGEHPALRQLYDWVIKLEQAGLARPTLTRGKGRWTLVPRVLSEQVGLVTIWNESGASISFSRSVFERHAPQTLLKVEVIIAPTRVGRGTNTRNITTQLLELLTEAYREAAS